LLSCYFMLSSVHTYGYMIRAFVELNNSFRRNIGETIDNLLWNECDELLYAEKTQKALQGFNL